MSRLRVLVNTRREPDGKRSSRAWLATGVQVAWHDAFVCKGHLGQLWATWCGCMGLTNESHGIAVIHGPVDDQAALHGLLRKVRELGLPLISVTRV